MPTTSQPAPTPVSSAPIGGQCTGLSVMEATSRLAAPSTTNVASTTSNITTVRASSFPASTDSRRGPRVSRTFMVSHPYSPPVVSTPSSRASAPANSGNPWIAAGTSAAGSASDSTRSPRLVPALGPDGVPR